MHVAADLSSRHGMPPLTLSHLRRGQVAIVLAVTHPAGTVRQKYFARGIVPGARLQVQQAGDPIVIAIDDSRWAVDGDEAAGIEVAVVEDRVRGWWQRAMQSMRRGGAPS